MNPIRREERLDGARLWIRVGFIATMASLAFGLRAVDPVTLPPLPVGLSCGAVTGLPCIFCGMTRALHHLLNGEFARALYFNWLAFLVAAAAFSGCVLVVAELLFRRRLLALPTFRVTPRFATITAALLVALWILQVSFAVSGQKRELLNPHGLLYALFVR